MAEGVTVHLIDDEEPVLAALAYAVTSAGYAARTYLSSQDFLRALPKLGGDFVVSDIWMPGLDGLELLRRLKGAGLGAPVLLMSGRASVQMTVEAMKSGAIGVLEKPFRPSILVSAIGEALGSRPGARKAQEPSPPVETIAGLTPRQRQVLQAVIVGKRNKTIAFELGLSVRTVETYRAQIMTLSHTSTLGELIRTAIAAGY